MRDIATILKEVEKLKHYSWPSRVRPELERATYFIYSTPTYEECLRRAHEASARTGIPLHVVKEYALARWYNFWTTEALYLSLKDNPLIRMAPEKKDKFKDMFIGHQAFDLKIMSLSASVSRREFDRLVENPLELIRTLEEGQSRARYHRATKLYLLVEVRDKSGKRMPHIAWREKKNIGVLKKALELYAVKLAESGYALPAVRCYAQGEEFVSRSDVIILMKTDGKYSCILYRWKKTGGPEKITVELAGA